VLSKYNINIENCSFFCMFSLFNFSSIFPGGGQLIPFAPMCGRPCTSCCIWQCSRYLRNTRYRHTSSPTLTLAALTKLRHCSWHSDHLICRKVSLGLYAVQNLIFTARCYASAVLAMGLCPSVCPSLTSPCSVETTERIELVFAGWIWFKSSDLNQFKS